MSRRKQVGSELNSIVRNKFVLIPVIAVMLVPLLYSALFLGAFWDPYAKLDKVPVAIINEDVGAELNGERLAIGDEFVDQLKESNNFKFYFVTREQADNGLEKNDYYIVIEIPERFSEQAISLVGDEPEQAELIYTPNEGYNFLAGQIGGTAVEKMTALLNKQITETYVTTVYDKLGEALEGIEAASDGAHQIADGATAANEGASKLYNGQQTLSDGLIQLQTGAKQLNTAGNQLATGLDQLQAGGSKLGSGMTQLTEGAQTIHSGLASLGQNYNSIDNGLTQLSDGTTALKEGALQLQAGLAQLAEQNSELASSASFQQLLAGSEQLVNGLLTQEQAESQLVSGSTQVKNGIGSLETGASQFVTKFAEANEGVNQLTTGLASAADGSHKLSSGLAGLETSSNQFVKGSSELLAGNKELVNGLTKLEDGSTELANELGSANGEALNLTLTDQMKEQFAEPVTITTVTHDEVPNYGTGFAPYFISLGLYVGCMLLTIVYSMREPALKPNSGASWYTGKTATAVIIAILQAIVLAGSIIVILDLEIANMGAFFLLAVITSLTFMMLIQLLSVSLDNVGRYIAVVLLILQLTSSAGTFPLELVPSWLQAVNPFLPMTYSVLGFKQAISSGDMSIFWTNTWPLLIMMVVCSVITYIYMTVSFKKKFQPTA